MERDYLGAYPGTLEFVYLVCSASQSMFNSVGIITERQVPKGRCRQEAQFAVQALDKRNKSLLSGVSMWPRII
jgi:hypothetical protein